MSFMGHPPRGMGRYIGELRQGLDGQLYEWVDGVDGLGNPIGFWKAAKAVGSAVGKAAGAVGRTVGKAAGAVVSTICPRAASYIPGFGGLGTGRYFGEMRQAPDGNLYQWEAGVDGLGNPVGFWKAIKAMKAVKAARRAIKSAGAGGTIARRALRRVAPRQVPSTSPISYPTPAPGDPGVGRYVGEIRQGPDGNLYQWEEGVDGLGNPIGFWKAAKTVGGAVGKAAGAVVGTVGKAAGAVGKAAGAVVGTVGKAAGAVGKAAGATVGTVGKAAGAVGKAAGFLSRYIPRPGLPDPLRMAFEVVVKSNQLSAKYQPVPSHFKKKLLAYAKGNKTDGAILLAGLARAPRFWQGGWIMKLQPDAGAMTLDTDVFFNQGEWRPDLYVHELVHVAQYTALGISGFLASYFGISLATILYRWCHNKPTNIIRSSPHEKQAYAIECRFMDWLSRREPSTYSVPEYC